MASALDALAEGVMVAEADLDAAGSVIVYVNPAWERMTGYAAAEAVGASARLLHGPATSTRVLERVRDALETDGETTFEVVAYRRDGTAFNMAAHVSPLRDGNGRLTHLVAVQRDVSGDRRTAARLHQLEALTRLQREVTTTGLDLDTRRGRVAEVARAVTGADGAAVEEPEGEELVYRTGVGSAHGDEGLRLPIDRSISGRAYTSRTPLLVRDIALDDAVVYKDKARALGFISGIVVPLIHEGESYGVLKVFADEPDRFAEEDRYLLELASGVLAACLHNAATHDREIQRRALLVDALPVLVSYLDTDFRYREVNAAYEDFFGIAADAIRGRHVSDLLGERVFRDIREPLEAARSGERINFEHVLTSPEGRTLHFEVDFIPHRDGDGSAVEGIYAIIRDVTEQRNAERDFLTRLANRGAFERRAAHMLTVAQRYGHPLSLVMVDVDHFKQLNDTLGHPAGDAVLQDFATVLNRVSREADLVGRWGGEEFAIVLPQTGAADAQILAERVRVAIEQHAFPHEAGVTVSLGVAGMARDDTLSDLTARADGALYRAKRAGRNRVAMADVVDSA